MQLWLFISQQQLIWQILILHIMPGWQNRFSRLSLFLPAAVYYVPRWGCSILSQIAAGHL